MRHFFAEMCSATLELLVDDKDPLKRRVVKSSINTTWVVVLGQEYEAYNAGEFCQCKLQNTVQ